MKALSEKIISGESLKKQMKTGVRFSEVVLGDTALIHSYFFRKSYIAYSDIRRIYMRVAGGEFGEFPVDEHSLVIEDMAGKEHALHLDRSDYILGIQEWIREHQPQILIGKNS